MIADLLRTRETGPTCGSGGAGPGRL